MSPKGLFLLAFAFLSVWAEKSTSLRHRELLESFECVLLEMAAEFDDPNDSQYEHICMAKGPDGEYNMFYLIDDNNGVIVHELNEDGLDIRHNSGRYKVTLTNVIKNLQPVVTTTPESTAEIEDLYESDDSRRRLNQVVGSRSMVIIRVTASDGVPTYSASDIANAFFGTAGDQMCLKKRYEECSFGKLTFNPGSGSGFTDGVAELTISKNFGGTSIHSLLNDITAAVIAQWGSSLKATYDHVVYAVPRGSTFGVGGSNAWLAFAHMNSYLSVYNDENIMYISNEVHETGHNLGLQHAMQGGNTYGDQSGVMGYGYGKFDFPKMCFNPGNYWQLGWEDDKSVEIDPNNGRVTVNLDAFVDYRSVPSGEYVLLKVGTKYIHYNKKKGMNSETQEFADQVTITDMPNVGDKTDLVGYLSPGQKYSFGSVTVEFCSATYAGGIDKAKVSIYNTSDGSGCNMDPGSVVAAAPPPTSPPTPAATNPPIPRPTNPPTKPPTQPTLKPVPQTSPPTLPPTGPSTEKPTPGPTAKPTAVPTAPPTPRPTPSPTTLPPTPAPTPVPCTQDEMKLVVDIRTDSKPGETTWFLKSRTGYPVGNGGPYDQAFHDYTSTFCIVDGPVYEFHLLDAGGDGIQSADNGHGSYTIILDGQVVTSGGTFQSEEVVYVQGDCPSSTDRRLQFTLATGPHPENVSWSLSSLPEGVINYHGGPWPDYAGQSINYYASSCLNAGLCYTLDVKHSGGTGGGSIEVDWGDKNVGFSNLLSGSLESFTFGDCQASSGRKLDVSEFDEPRIESFITV